MLRVLQVEGWLDAWGWRMANGMGFCGWLASAAVVGIKPRIDYRGFLRGGIVDILDRIGG